MAFDFSANVIFNRVSNLQATVNQVKKAFAGTEIPVKIRVDESSLSKLSGYTKSATSSFSTLNKEIKETATSTNNFSHAAELAGKRFLAFSLAAGVIIKTTQAIRAGTDAIIQFDKQLTRLAQISGTSKDGVKSLGDEIIKVSKNFGVAIDDITQAAVVLKQAGLSAKDTSIAIEVLAKTSLAPNFDDMTKTTEGLIAILEQFKGTATSVGLSAKDLNNVFGSINQVASDFAVEAGDIIEAVRRVGSVFRAATPDIKNSTDTLNELIALFTSVRATTRQSAETIATGLRTIFTRLQRTDTISDLRDLGIELRDLNGQFVGPYEAVRRLSDALANIPTTDEKFARVTELLGGFRQVQNTIPLLRQFALAQQALQTAQRGQSSLDRDAALAQDALFVKIQKVKNEYIDLALTIGRSEAFKQLAGIALNLASAFASFGKSIAPLIPLITALFAFKAGQTLFGIGGSLISKLNHPSPSAFPVKRAMGGVVPGSGRGDTVPAMLEGGEYVIRRDAAKKIGYDKLQEMNGYANGGKVDLSRLIRGKITSYNDPRIHYINDTANELANVFGEKSLSYDKLKDINLVEQPYLNSIKGGKQYPIGRYYPDKRSIDLARRAFSPVIESNSVAHELAHAIDYPITGGQFISEMSGTKANLLSDLFRRNVLANTSDVRIKELREYFSTNPESFAETFGIALSQSSKSQGAASSIIQSIYGKKVSPIGIGQLKKDNGEIALLKAIFGGKKFAKGGEVPALLESGEFVINRNAADAIGSGNLHRLNNADKYHSGGFVRGFVKGGPGAEGEVLGIRVIAKTQQELNKVLSTLELVAQKFNITAQRAASFFEEINVAGKTATIGGQKSRGQTTALALERAMTKAVTEGLKAENIGLQPVDTSFRPKFNRVTGDLRNLPYVNNPLTDFPDDIDLQSSNAIRAASIPGGSKYQGIVTDYTGRTGGRSGTSRKTDASGRRAATPGEIFDVKTILKERADAAESDKVAKYLAESARKSDPDLFKYDDAKLSDITAKDLFKDARKTRPGLFGREGLSRDAEDALAARRAASAIFDRSGLRPETPVPELSDSFYGQPPPRPPSNASLATLAYIDQIKANQPQPKRGRLGILGKSLGDLGGAVSNRFNTGALLGAGLIGGSYISNEISNSGATKTATGEVLKDPTKAGIGGAFGGVIAGAATGAVFGLPGAVIGGVVGGIVGFVSAVDEAKKALEEYSAKQSSAAIGLAANKLGTDQEDFGAFTASLGGEAFSNQKAKIKKLQQEQIDIESGKDSTFLVGGLGIDQGRVESRQRKINEAKALQDQIIGQQLPEIQTGLVRKALRDNKGRVKDIDVEKTVDSLTKGNQFKDLNPQQLSQIKDFVRTNLTNLKAQEEQNNAAKIVEKQANIFTNSLFKLSNAIDNVSNKFSELSSSVDNQVTRLTGGQSSIQFNQLTKGVGQFGTGSQEFEDSVRSISKLVGPNSAGSAEHFLQLSKAKSFIPNELDRIVAKDPQASNSTIIKTLKRSLEDERIDINLPTISELLKKLGGEDDLATKVRSGEALKTTEQSITDSTKGLIKVFDDAAKALDSGFNDYQKSLTNIFALTDRINQYRGQELDTGLAANRFDAERRAANAGDFNVLSRLGNSDLEVFKQKNINLTGLEGNAAIDPETLANKIREGLNKSKNTEDLLRTIDPKRNEEQYKLLFKELAGVQLETRNYQSALENLTRITDAAVIVQAKINDLRVKEQAQIQAAQQYFFSTRAEKRQVDRGEAIFKQLDQGRNLNDLRRSEQRNLQAYLSQRGNTAFGKDGLIVNERQSQIAQRDLGLAEAPGLKEQRDKLENIIKEAYGVQGKASKALAELLVQQQKPLFDNLDSGFKKFFTNLDDLFKQFRAGNFKAQGGFITYMQGGGLSRGTDTVPAMLTPGEFVVNRASAQANKSLLKHINDSKGPAYLADGGLIDRLHPEDATRISLQGREIVRRNKLRVLTDSIFRSDVLRNPNNFDDQIISEAKRTQKILDSRLGPRTGGTADLGLYLARRNRQGRTINLLKRNSGGIVPGLGMGDSVPALLTPGEYVMNRQAVRSIGLNNIQHLADGGEVSRKSGEGNRYGTSFIDRFDITISRFSKSITDFSRSANILSEALKSFPRSITLSATHQLNVTVTGAEAFNAMLPEMKKIATEATRDGLNRLIKDKFPDVGPVI